MDLIALAIVGVVALSVVALVAMARRRSWNADGSDDERRPSRDEDRDRRP